MQLFREILKRITYEIDASGKIIQQIAAASSISLHLQSMTNQPANRLFSSFILPPSDLCLLTSSFIITRHGFADRQKS